MSKAYTDARKRANEKWLNRNKERKAYLNQRSHTRSFIRNRATEEDLEELETLIEERRLTMMENTIKDTVVKDIKYWTENVISNTSYVSPGLYELVYALDIVYELLIEINSDYDITFYCDGVEVFRIKEYSPTNIVNDIYNKIIIADESDEVLTDELMDELKILKDNFKFRFNSKDLYFREYNRDSIAMKVVQ